MTKQYFVRKRYDTLHYSTVSERYDTLHVLYCTNPDAGARRGKKGPPTRPSPHHRPPSSPPTKGLRHGAPHRPGGASPPHHHRRPIHPRRPRTPLGPQNHPSDAPPTAGPQRSRHPFPGRSTPKPQGHPTPPPLQDVTSHRIVGHPGHAPPTTRQPHPQSGRPTVVPPLGTRSPLGGPGLYPGNKPGRPPTGQAATPLGHHPHRPRRRPLGNPPHSTLLGSRLPQRPRHTGTHGDLGHAGQGHEGLPPSPPLRRQPGRTAMPI